MIQGPITDWSIDIGDDAGYPGLKACTIPADAMNVQAAGKYHMITVCCSITHRPAHAMFLPHSLPIIGEAIDIPIAARAEIAFPVGGFVRDTEKKLEAGLPPQFVTTRGKVAGDRADDPVRIAFHPIFYEKCPGSSAHRA